MEEVWKDVVGYEGIYQISDKGRLKRLERFVEVDNRSDFVLKEKILKGWVNEDGYRIAFLNKDFRKSKHKIHQLVAVAFLNHKPCGLELIVTHKNLDKLDNRAENLKLVPHRQNSSERYLNSSSKYAGVSKKGNSYKASICFNGRLKYLGSFKNEQDAANSYIEALKCVNEGRVSDIKVKKAKYSSDYKGVYLDNRRNRWRARIKINNKKKHLGYFESEYDAHLAYQKALKELTLKT